MALFLEAIRRDSGSLFRFPLFNRIHVLSFEMLIFLFPIGGMPTGPKVFLDLAGRVWAAVLRPDPLKNALCRTCPVVGRRTDKVPSVPIKTNITVTFMFHGDFLKTFLVFV